jgi:ketosteroid isomerase-like protein
MHSNKCLLRAAGVLLILPMLVPAFAWQKRENAQIRKEIQAMYDRLDKAARDKDLAFVKSVEADEFTRKKKDGTVVGREEADAELQQVFGMVKEVRVSSTTIDKVIPTEDADEVLVEATSRADIILATPDGQTHQLAGSGKDRDTWVSTDHGWKLKSSEELESSYKMDGKPIQ